MNQRDGVYSAVVKVVGEVDGAIALTKDQKEQVYALISAGFKSGSIEFKGGCPDDAKLAKYIPGLVNNWVRKDTRLNGDVKYTAKRPGSRAGSGDESLKAMKALLAMTPDEDAKRTIQAAITQRQAELKPKATINTDALPPALRKFVTA